MRVEPRTATVAAGAATSPQELRRTNARLLLDMLWHSEPGQGFTAGELSTRTTLTRATVLSVCQNLVDLGWVAETQQAAITPPRGRPAKWFALRPDAGFAMGVDVGLHHLSVVVADLRGTIVGRAGHRFEGASRARSRVTRAVIDQALADAGIAHTDVHAICFGLAAPVDEQGHIPPGNKWWDPVDITSEQVLSGLDWAVLIENDANLAAQAERDQGLVDPNGCFTVLLAGEAFGAGVIERGRLMRGHRGGAGELEILSAFAGVKDPRAIDAYAGRWAQEELTAGAPSTLRANWLETGERPATEDVLRAADQGDPLAERVLARLADRLALVVAVLASLANPEVVVIAGEVAPWCDRLIALTQERIHTYTRMAPRIVASSLAGDVVVVGAVRVALTHVRTHALDRLFG